MDTYDIEIETKDNLLHIKQDNDLVVLATSDIIELYNHIINQYAKK